MDGLNKYEFLSKEDLEKYKNEMFSSICSDKEFIEYIKKEGFSLDDIKNNISLFNNYLDNYNIVKNIKDYQDCVKYGVSSRLILKKDGNEIIKTYDVLDPVKENMAYFSRFIIKDFPSEMDYLSLNDLDNKSLKNKILGKIKNGNWIYLNGATRSGKTYCSICFLNYLMKNYKGHVAFLDATVSFQNIINLFFSHDIDDKNEFYIILKKLIKCKILVIDNFGMEYKNSHIRDAFLIPLIDGRNKEKCITIINSCYSINDIDKLYKFKSDVWGLVSKHLMDVICDKSDGEIVTSVTANLYK